MKPKVEESKGWFIDNIGWIASTFSVVATLIGIFIKFNTIKKMCSEEKEASSNTDKEASSNNSKEDADEGFVDAIIRVIVIQFRKVFINPCSKRDSSDKCNEKSEQDDPENIP